MTEKIGILFINIGTPEAPTEEAVRDYLAEFLGDPYVVDYPKWLWKIILNNFILRSRPARSARLYAKIWEETGSPLLHIMQAISDKVEVSGSGYVTAVGMRYGEPSIRSAMQELKQREVTHLVVFPVFPHFSSSTTGTAIDHTKIILADGFDFDRITFIEEYHQNTLYIEALAKSIGQVWQKEGKPEKLLFSFHGVPLRYITKKGEPYKEQCMVTAELVAEQLGLAEGDYLVSFQSRFGPEKWLEPYTDETLAKLGAEKSQRIDVICPGFATDCLETLEEIAMEGKAEFQEAGGGKFTYIPALNERDAHIDALIDIAQRAIGA